MSVKASGHSDIPRILFANGVLILREFWKLSCHSKDLLALRDDTTSLGLGSVCAGFVAVSEREDLWKVLVDCCARDDVKALRQLLALQGVSGRYPFLLRRLMKDCPSEDNQCVEFMLERGETPSSTEFPREALYGRPKRHLVSFLQHSLHPDSWMEGKVETYYIPPADYFGKSETVLGFEYTQPLLMAFISAEESGSVETLLDAGARVDVCEWRVYANDAIRSAHGGSDAGSEESEGEEREPERKCESTPLLRVVDRFRSLRKELCDFQTDREEEEEEEGIFNYVRYVSEEREKWLPLLRRIAEASKETGCLSWWSVWGGREDSALGFACLWREAEAARVLLEVEGGVQRRDLPFLAFAEMEERGGKKKEGGVEKRKSVFDQQCADLLRVLGEAGISLSRMRRDGHSPLSLACFLGLERSAQSLLEMAVPAGGVEEGKRQNSAKGEGVPRSPLIEAIAIKSETLVSLLLLWGADVNEVGLVGLDAERGEFSYIRKVEEEADPPVFFALATPLQVALRRLHSEDERFSGGGGSQKGQREEERDARRIARISIAKLLINHGAKCSLPSPLAPDHPMSEYLISESHPHPNSPPPVFPDDPLAGACELWDTDLLRLLCDKGGQIRIG
uniref:Uncharacterized protein n=1 Tax=Chromera velia CCMP2878 TaxID=1169474 RepID=A0A0G4GN68_9ALVE|eukprot:Cvel_22615.t1-p1 / transcript=Cvel_22615.t1 / gene=Cvel_22615 / organism=Chromera_velia_CCMP2878 / gene_product=hypothetical protein / transcript_product=hypothetical protein / location=Cvel_scaffold2240:1239-3104(-) / protein_length=622 / sequence_SO=supercontig / SO=protein_coding / is_pseudo=false